MASMTDRPIAPPSISVQQVEMPRGGGGVRGMGEHFQAEAFSGEFSFGIPLLCSPCRDFEPTLELAYGSMAGNGVFGLGFAVALSSVTRQTSRRIPRYDSDDVFLLDGVQLTPVAEGTAVRTVGATYSVTGYRPRHEVSFDRVEHWQSSDVDFWRVIDRSGVISVYGRTDATRVTDPGDPARIAQWLIEYSVHPHGDVRAFSYKQEDTSGVPAVAGESARSHTANRYPERIRYGNAAAYATADGGVTPIPEQDWHFEVVFDYGEYDIDPANDTPYPPVRPWSVRQDPFSDYRYGFELRTHRLCRNVLMFHRFTELGPEPVLVHAIGLGYDENPAGTTLTECGLVGYRRYPGLPSGQRYRTRAVPPLAMTYAPFEPGANLAATMLADVDGSPIEGCTGESGWAVVDLYRDGVPGLLYADGQTVYYRRPMLVGPDDAATFTWSAREPLPGFPVARTTTSEGMALCDLDGDGRLELLSVGNGTNGRYPARADGGWDPYIPFTSTVPGFFDPGYGHADLVGDGRSDIVWRQADAIGWFASLGSAGFDAARFTPADPELPPTLEGADYARERVIFADPLGGGVSSLVRITDGAIDCWPGLGYGRFGTVVRMAGVPLIGEEYDARRVWLADLDGSGTPALVYAHADHLAVYPGLGGNGFAAEPVRVPLPAVCARPDQLLFADLTGSGYDCVVFCTDDPQPRAWAIDLCAGTKPYLVTTVDNGQGTRRSIGYRGCAYDRLRDARAGTPWITSIPFALQVVAEVVETDQLSGVDTPIAYHYHHGHYDHVEREFHGFGMVEETDARQNALLTRTWFHTGAWLADEPLEAAYRREYFHDDPAAWPPCAVVYDLGTASVDPAAAREAAVALSGEILREERYGLDGSPAQHVPFDVSEHGYRVRMLQPPGDGRRGVFTVHERDSVAAHYERQAGDPLVRQHFVLECDERGEILLECAVACARRPGAPDPASGQDVPRAMATRRGWYSITDQPDTWLLGEPAEQRSWEITGLAAPDVDGRYFSFAAIDRQVRAAIAGDPGATAELVEAFTYRYVGEPITPQALLIARAEAFAEQETLTTVFAGQPIASTLRDVLTGAGGYRLDDGLWWNPSTSETYHELSGFYRPASTSDPFGPAGSGTTVAYGYDDHWLLLVSATMRANAGDVLPHTMTATRLDYIALAACQVHDENNGVHEGQRDPLGVVVVMSSYGREWHDGQSQDTGFAPLDFDRPPPIPSSLAQLLDAPETYLAGAAETLYYQWHTAGTPTVLASLTATSYSAGPIEITLTYHDGASRELQETALAEPAPDDQRPRWRTSTRFSYDERGRPTRAWQPSFSDDYAYVPVNALPDAGICSTASYDPLDRIVRIDHAEGSMTEAFITTHQYGPWTQTSADRNDTILDSAYYQHYVRDKNPGLDQWDLDALTKAAGAHDTPTVAVSDNLGNRCELRTLAAPGADPLIERAGYDIIGRELWAADPRLSATGLRNIERWYTFAGDALRIDSVDAGSRWILRNAVGKVIYQYDSRGFVVVTSYDGLHRVTEVKVSGGDGDASGATTELHIYGDSLDTTGRPPVPDPAARNLIGHEWHRYDDSGAREQASFSLTQQPLATTNWSRAGYASEVDWRLPAAPDWATRVAGLASALDGEPQNQSMTYDALGRLVGMTDPAGNTTAWTLHVSGLPDALTWTPAGGTARRYVTQTRYGADEQPTSVVFGDTENRPVIATERVYDPRNSRLRSVTTTRLADAALVGRLVYHLDPVGNVTHIEQSVPSAPAAPTADRDHTFDALYRLVESHGRVIGGYSARDEQDPAYDPFFGAAPPEPYTGRFTYDTGDNLTDLRYETTGGGWSHSLTVAPGSNRAVPEPTGGTFDAGGNLRTLDGLTLDWSFAGRLRRISGNGQTAYLLYDVNGNRTATIVECGRTVTRTRYLGSLDRHRVTTDGQVTEEYDCARLALDDDTAGGVALHWRTGAPPPGATMSWFQFTDLLGSAMLEVDDTGTPRHGEEYLPYGGTALAYATAGAADIALKPRRYSGQVRDGVGGLYCYGLRSYACWLGRWVSPDPELDADGLNLYAFTHDNPVTFVDEFGLNSKKKGTKKAPKTKPHHHTKHRSKDIRHSRFRFFRRMQYGVGGTRNIAMLKMRRISGSGPKVLYIIARSMGLGVSKMTLRDEEVTTKSGSLKRRSHSEAVLRAILEVGTVKYGKTRISLDEYSTRYAASTNQGCGVQHENCAVESVPFLAGRFYYANKYGGSKQAAGFEKLNNEHQRKVKNEKHYESDSESEDEGTAIVADEKQFRGYDRGHGVKEITATPFGKYMRDAKKPRKKVYDDKNRRINY